MSKQLKKLPASLVAVRNKVLAAFKILRKNGFVARSRFRSCMSDAEDDIDELQRNSKDKHSTVFWHSQTEDNFWDDGVLFLYFGPDATAGEAVAKVIEKQGLIPLWDHTASRGIAVCDIARLKELIDGLPEDNTCRKTGFMRPFLERAMREYRDCN